MEEQIVVYIYREIYGEANTPFSKVKLEANILKAVRESFVQNGGLRTFDVEISKMERWRISYWKNAQAYKKWESDKNILEYFDLRKKHNLEQNIAVELQGPFDAKEVASV